MCEPKNRYTYIAQVMTLINTDLFYLFRVLQSVRVPGSCMGVEHSNAAATVQH